MKKLIYSLFLFFALASCQAQDGNGTTQTSGNSATSVLSVKDYQAILTQKGIQLVDVRTAEEFLSGHIPGAKNIDVRGADFSTKISGQLDKNQPVAVYCRTGKRSQTAAVILKNMGFKTIYDLQGGYIAWTAQ